MHQSLFRDSNEWLSLDVRGRGFSVFFGSLATEIERAAVIANFARILAVVYSEGRFEPTTFGL
jgi:hypothetical protein